MIEFLEKMRIKIKKINDGYLISEEYLIANPDKIFVFGDNTIRRGKGGAAKLRDLPNTYGFITKKYPNNKDESFFRPDEYREVFKTEMLKLIKEIRKNPDKTYLISKFGYGLANKYNIFEKVIKPGSKILEKYYNVEFLYDKER